MVDRVTVLHVDDDPQIRDILSQYFKAEDERFTIESVGDAEQALERLTEGHIDCIVSDYSMEPIDGIELLKRVRADYPDIPFMLFTMRGNEQVASDAIEAGATDYVLKRTGPDQFDLLANRILNAVEQYRSKQTTRQTRRRLEELTEAATDVLWIYSPDWEELEFVNSRVEELYGVSQERLEEEPLAFLEATHPKDRSQVRDAMEQLTAGHAVNIEYRVNEAEGYGRWAWVDAKPVLDEDGEVSRIVGFSRDVTERTERSQELQELKERYQAYVENASDLITVIDADGTITYQSPSAQRVLGYDPAEVIGRNAFELVHPDDRVETRAEFQTLQEQPKGSTRTFQFRLERSDGTWGWFEAVGTNRADSAMTGHVITSRDITERKRRERTLTALHSAAEEIVRAETPATVYEILSDTAEEVLEFDLVAVDIEHDGFLIQEAWTLELEDGDYFDRTSLEEDDTMAVRAYNRQETIVVDDLSETSITPAATEYQSVLTVPIGQFGTFQAVSTEAAAFDRNDIEFAEQLVGHVQVKLEQLQDRQALEKRTEQLQRQNDRLDEFVSVVSHDLRNPVTVAQGHTDLLQNEYDDDRLDEIEWAVDRMETLIDDLLTLARNGAQVDEFESIDIDTLLQNCWRTVETGDASLVIESDRTIYADEDRCRQLVENLLRNAIEHGGTAVTVTIGDLDGGFYIEDDGPGIPADQRDRVFETGYSTADDGTGFGLNIVKQIANAHGWEVSVSDGTDGGARFELTGVESADVV